MTIYTERRRIRYRRVVGWGFAAALAVWAVGAVLSSNADARTQKVTATVVSNSDADSVRLRIPGIGLAWVHVAGINAPVGSCTDATAVEKMAELLPVDSSVEVRGDLQQAPDAFGEIRLRVFVAEGEVAKTMLKKGLAVAMPARDLPSTANEKYRRWAKVAQKKGRQLWNPKKCAKGPKQHAELALRTRWDADGKDELNLGGEWVEVVNTGDVTVNLNHWQLTDGSDTPGHRSTFPKRMWLRPGRSVRVEGGPGGTYNWKNDEPLFAETGDGVYLLDPDTDIRSFSEFPCLWNCSDPLIGKVSVVAHYDAAGNDADNVNGEWVDLVNRAEVSIDVRDHFLRNGVNTYFFDEPTILGPGQRLRLHVGLGDDSPLVRYWGKTEPILGNTVDYVELLGMDGTLVTEHRWPCPCGPVPDVRIVFANPGGDLNSQREWIDLRNFESTPVVVGGWQVLVGINEYVIPDGVEMPAGGSLRVDFHRGADTTSIVHWDTPEILGPSSDEITLKTPLGDLASCYGWGGSGCDRPTVNVPLTLIVNFDANGANNGDGAETANGEWARLRNAGTTPFDLTGYRLMYDGAVFTLDDIILPEVGGGRFTLRSGSPPEPGAGGPLDRYWGVGVGIYSGGIYPNMPSNPQTMTLFDLDGAIAAEYTWPCSSNCTAPHLTVELHNESIDWMTIRNREAFPVSLDDWLITESPNASVHYYFPDGIVLDPGGKATITITIYGNGTDDPGLGQYYWYDETFFTEFGNNERIALLDPRGVTAWCQAWGTGSCSS